MNNGKSKLIYWMAGIIIVLVSSLWAYTVVSQTTKIAGVELDLKTHQVTQQTDKVEDVRWKTSIDNRLANIEKAMGIDGYKK